MTATPEEFFTFLKKIHNNFQPLAEKIIFDKHHAHHRTIVILYGSIFELIGSCITLFDNKQIIAIPILLRSILEAYVDLINLINNAEYGYHLEAKWVNELLKFLDEAKTGNEFITHLTSISDEMINQLKSKKQKLKKDKYNPLKIEEKFKRAGMLKEYKSIFGMYCLESHNNLASLLTRHVQHVADDFSIIFYKSQTIHDSMVYILLITEYFIKSTEILHEFLNSPVKDVITKHRLEFNALHTPPSC